MFQRNDLEISSSSRENVDLSDHGLQSYDLETFHAGLQSTDWIDFSNQNTRASAPHGESTALSDIAVSANESTLASNHNVGCAHDSIRQRVPATVNVIKLGFRDAVVHIDG